MMQPRGSVVARRGQQHPFRLYNTQTFWTLSDGHLSIESQLWEMVSCWARRSWNCSMSVTAGMMQERSELERRSYAEGLRAVGVHCMAEAESDSWFDISRFRVCVLRGKQQ